MMVAFSPVRNSYRADTAHVELTAGKRQEKDMHFSVILFLTIILDKVLLHV